MWKACLSNSCLRYDRILIVGFELADEMRIRSKQLETLKRDSLQGSRRNYLEFFLS